MELLASSLNCGSPEAALGIYEACPPEHLLLAIAAAYLKRGRESGLRQ
jgi:hypothetical protein